MPTIDHQISPFAAATITVPTNGTVQVKLVRVNVRPMSRRLAMPCPLPEAMVSLVRIPDGTTISNKPNRFRAKMMKMRAIRMFIHGFAAN